MDVLENGEPPPDGGGSHCVLAVDLDVVALPGSEVHFHHCAVLDPRVWPNFAFLLEVCNFYVDFASVAAVLDILACATILVRFAELPAPPALCQNCIL